jgi:diketogulonate reductase-like aldo/keto reductase
LRTGYLDVYVLHWRGDVPLEETMEALERLVVEGKIRALGVSNLDPWDLREASAALEREPIACNQILYNLGERTIEAHEAPWTREHDAALVAYTPLARPRGARAEAVLAKIARAHDATLEAIALAFLLRLENAFVIPKANRIAHVEANARAAAIVLREDEIAAIDRAYPVRERTGALPTN